MSDGVRTNQEGMGANLGEKISEAFSFPKLNIPNPLQSSVMEKIWQSPPAKVLISAGGWTMGVKAVTMLTPMLGPMGIVFAGMSALGAIDHAKNKNKPTVLKQNRPKTPKSKKPPTRRKKSEEEYDEE